MNISYEKSKLLKDIETKYPRTKKNRFTRNLLNLLYLLNLHTPLQMVSELYGRVRVRIYMLESKLDLELKQFTYN